MNGTEDSHRLFWTVLEAAPFTVRSTPDLRNTNWIERRKGSHNCSDCPNSKVGAARTVMWPSEQSCDHYWFDLINVPKTEVLQTVKGAASSLPRLSSRGSQNRRATLPIFTGVIGNGGDRFCVSSAHCIEMHKALFWRVKSIYRHVLVISYLNARVGQNQRVKTLQKHIYCTGLKKTLVVLKMYHKTT
jgi:ribosomal protein L37AE/L43A